VIDAYAIASICGILTTMDPVSTEFRNTKDLIKTWAAEVNMPQKLKLKMLEYIDESQGIIRQRYYGAPARASLAVHGSYSLNVSDNETTARWIAPQSPA
jgi:hypothetical protein